MEVDHLLQAGLVALVGPGSFPDLGLLHDAGVHPQGLARGLKLRPVAIALIEELLDARSRFGPVAHSEHDGR